MANIVFKDPETGAQRSIQIRQSPFLIGRASDNDLILNDSSVSKLHCKIVAEANGLHVIDLKSKRGTTINGAPVEDSEVLAETRLAWAECNCSSRISEMHPAIRAHRNQREGRRQKAGAQSPGHTARALGRSMSSSLTRLSARSW